MKPIPTKLHKINIKTLEKSEVHINTGYFVDESGRVFSNRQGKLNELSSNRIKSGYLQIALGGKNVFYVHRLVAEVFIDNPLDLPIIDHIDGNRSNNCVDNLRWCTQAQNIQWAMDSGRMDFSESMKWAKKIWLDDIEFPSIGSAARWIASEYGASEKSVAKRLRLKDTGLTFGHEFRKTPYRINIIPAPKVKVRDAYQGEFRPIKGHEGTYSISRSGDVISHKRYFDKVLAPEIRGDKKRVNLAGRKLVVSDLVSAAYS